jgi:hypothetical protein
MNVLAGRVRGSEDVLDVVPREAPTGSELRAVRDRQRGYSINIKQIILAFAVEFVIIGLILTNTLLMVAQLPDVATAKIIQAMLFPIAMAMVELARVPLAIAVRTQTSWNIKLASLLGVLCAVAVTSNSLYSIGAASFTPRLEDTHKKDSLIKELEDRQQQFKNQIDTAREEMDRRERERNTAGSAVQSLQAQLAQQKPADCAVVTVPPSPAAPPGTPPLTKQVCRENPLIKRLESDISIARTKANDAEAVVKQAQDQYTKAGNAKGLREIQEQITKATTENRESIFQSQLHSLAAMIFGVDPNNVTPDQIKKVEFYLIFVSSIAAAFSSTLIAMTAVRRIKIAETDPNIELPDEAMTYLFGPLLVALRQEAREAVQAAMKDNATGKVPSR